jgi:hypothetical protein
MIYNNERLVQVRCRYYATPDATIKECYQNAHQLQDAWDFDVVQGWTEQNGILVEHYFNRENEWLYWDSTPIVEYCGDDVVYYVRAEELD